VRKKSDITGKVSLILGSLALLTIFGVSIITFVADLQIGFAVPEYLEALMLCTWTFWLSRKLVRYHRTFEKFLSKK